MHVVNVILVYAGYARDIFVRHPLAVPSFNQLVSLQCEQDRLRTAVLFAHEDKLSFLIRKPRHVEEISVGQETVIRILTHRSSLPREKKNR